MKTLLFTFADDTERDKFLEMVRTMEVNANDKEWFDKTLDSIRLDPPIKADHERQCAIWIGPDKLLEGSLADLNRRFDQEVASHSGSVVLKELRNGEWKIIRQRRLQ